MLRTLRPLARNRSRRGRVAAGPSDHLAAVSTLIAGTRERATGAAARLGLTWGLGHALSLFAFGLPIVLFQRYLPEHVQEGAETAVGFVIVLLAISLLLRDEQRQHAATSTG